jgi:hypothetical protein
LSNQLKTVAQVFQADSKQKNLLSKSGWIWYSWQTVAANDNYTWATTRTY